MAFVGAYHETALPDRPYTAAEVDAALGALMEPGRLAHAQEIVIHSAPALQRLLAEALEEGGWFGTAHQAEVDRACREPDPDQRALAVGTLAAEQARLGMLVGVAVGFELSHTLQAGSERADSDRGPEEHGGPEEQRGASELRSPADED